MFSVTEDRTRPTATTEAEESASPIREPLKVTFSVPQILGGALAAATAAALGSTLGVAGTVIGASVASVIGGVAGTLYSAGIDRTHRTVTAAIKRGYDRVSVVQPSDAETAATAEGMPEAPDADQVKVTVAPPAPSSQRRRLLVRMGVTAAAIFAIAAVAITVIELTTGHSLDGSQGTTVGQVGRPRPVPSASTAAAPTTTPTPDPVPSATETAPVPSESPAPAPSASVEPSPIPVPTPAPTQS
ncbi:MAG: hypothetical protein LWW77_01325 [Propionibacteriales bacterium]|nr:hypothetical protein [Propionibacteriales bacterium]